MQTLPLVNGQKGKAIAEHLGRKVPRFLHVKVNRLDEDRSPYCEIGLE